MRLKYSLLVTIFFLVITQTIGQKKVISNPFFVFNSGVKSGGFETLEEQASLLKKLKYDGVEKEGLDEFKAMQQAMNGRGLIVYTNYVKIDLDNTLKPYDKKLLEVFEMVQGKPTMIWVHVVSKKYKPSSKETDKVAVPILRDLADKASRFGVKIMVYPHINNWIECAEDAIRICEKVNRDNFGMTFNLCHFLAHSNREDKNPDEIFPTLAKEAIPYLFAISLNGADSKPKDKNGIWDSFIQPLGLGSYDTYGYLKTFLDLGFEGPVGLQTYGIKQNSNEHLTTSIKTWKSYKNKYASGE